MIGTVNAGSIMQVIMYGQWLCGSSKGPSHW